MSVIVTDQGFTRDDWPRETRTAHGARDKARALDLPADTAPEALAGALDGLTHIRIAIAGFADGRGLTLARQVRRMGFQGRLRAQGPVISDQYTMARRAGFDEVEIPDSLAARQPETEWLARAAWQAPSHLARLRG